MRIWEGRGRGNMQVNTQGYTQHTNNTVDVKNRNMTQEAWLEIHYGNAFWSPDRSIHSLIHAVRDREVHSSNIHLPTVVALISGHIRTSSREQQSSMKWMPILVSFVNALISMALREVQWDIKYQPMLITFVNPLILMSLREQQPYIKLSLMLVRFVNGLISMSLR